MAAFVAKQMIGNKMSAVKGMFSLTFNSIRKEKKNDFASSLVQIHTYTHIYLKKKTLLSFLPQINTPLNLVWNLFTTTTTSTTPKQQHKHIGWCYALVFLKFRFQIYIHIITPHHLTIYSSFSPPFSFSSFSQSNIIFVSPYIYENIFHKIKFLCRSFFS